MFIFNFFIKLLGTWFFIGYIPVVPATFGTLGAIPFILLFKNFELGILGNIVCAILFLIFSIFVSHFAENIFKIKDDRRIVIDEVAGFFVATLLIPYSFWFLITTFFLFRFFDVVKFFPARQCQYLRGGFGVVFDDIVAGIQTGLVIFLFSFLFYWARYYL